MNFVQIGASAGGDEVFDFFKNKHADRDWETHSSLSR